LLSPAQQPAKLQFKFSQQTQTSHPHAPYFSLKKTLNLKLSVFKRKARRKARTNARNNARIQARGEKKAKNQARKIIAGKASRKPTNKPTKTNPPRVAVRARLGEIKQISP